MTNLLLIRPKDTLGIRFCCGYIPGDTQLCGNVQFCYSSFCQDYVMGLVNSGQRLAFQDRVIFQAPSLTFEFSSLLLYHVVRRGTLL